MAAQHATRYTLVWRFIAHSAVLFRRHITHSPHRDLRAGHLSEAQFLRFNSEWRHHCTTVTSGVFHACFTPPARDTFLDYCPLTSVSHACTRTPHPRRAPNSRHTGTAPCCRNRRRPHAALEQLHTHPPQHAPHPPAPLAEGAPARKNGGMADERESKELQSGTLVIGLGRFGSAVAVTQDQLGYEILAVEKNPARVQAFAGRFPLVEADATSKDALEQLGAREFRSAVVGVGSSLEAAVLITANLVDMGISSIWVKATSSQHGRILRRVGAHHVVYPDLDAGKRTAHLVGGRMVDYIEMEKDGFSIMKLRPPQEVHGFSLEELDLRGRYGVNVLAVRHPKQRFEYADATTRINADDEIIVSGDSHLLEYFANRP